MEVDAETLGFLRDGFSRFLSLCCFDCLLLWGLGFPFFKLEANLPRLFIKNEVSIEGAALLGDELGEKAGFSGAGDGANIL